MLKNELVVFASLPAKAATQCHLPYWVVDSGSQNSLHTSADLDLISVY